MAMHLRKLEESRYVSCRKTFVGRRPKTTYRITNTGRKALAQYLEMMQQVINEVERSQNRSNEKG